MITVTALALLIYLFADTPILKGDRKMNALNRKKNNPNPSRRLRRWFSSRRRRHDPREARPGGSQFRGTGWIVFNISTFTFDGQPLPGFNRFASHDNIWR